MALDSWAVGHSKVSSESEAVPSRTEVAVGWIRNNRQTFIGCVIILAAAIIFSAFFFVHYRNVREAAWQQLFIARQLAYSGKLDEGMKKMEDIENTYGSSSAATFAALTRGDIYYAQEKFDDALKIYTKAAASSRKEIRPFAVYDSGKTKEAMNDYSGAIDQYTGFLAQYPSHFLAPEVMNSLANVYILSGDTNNAKSIYVRLSELYPDTDWGKAAKAKLAPVSANPQQPAVTQKTVPAKTK